MRNSNRFAMSLGTVALAGGICLAQTPTAPPGPGPEHKKLARYVGSWTGKAQMKPGPFGPGGPMTWTESCEWFPGGFAIVCKSEGKGPLGETKGLSVLGFDTEKKVYTFFGVDSTGWSDHAEGTVSGKIWTYTSKGTMGGKPMHGRFVLTEVSDTRHTMTWDMSEDGKTWNRMMDGEASK